MLTPGRYVGAAKVEDDGEPFEEKMERLTTDLRESTEQSAKLDQLIRANLEALGYGECVDTYPQLGGNRTSA